MKPSAVSRKSGEALQKLREFGYAFNAEGQLRKIDKTTGEAGDEPFVFEISKDAVKNQAHYEKLADQIPEIVYDLLEQNGLTRTYFPENLPLDVCTFFFSQPKELVNSKKLIVLIHGSGYVRAGQWARSLIINNSLDHGTQIPYIKRAQTLNYDILVTNHNDNSHIVNGERKPVPGINGPIDHMQHVWENYIIPSNPESVAIVAHSYGGALVFEMAKRFPEFFKEKVFAIALTDSAHGSLPPAVKSVVTDIACNWVACDEPLDTEIGLKQEIGLHCVSAGHHKHEWTSYSAFESVFKFIEAKYQKFIEAKKLE